MAEFLCKVADGSGRVFQHIEPAETMAEARQKLSDRGLFSPRLVVAEPKQQTEVFAY